MNNNTLLEEDIIIGHWRPVDSFVLGQIPDPSPQFRDLILNDDLTFHAIGNNTYIVRKEGWNNSMSQKGKWSYANSILFLWIDGVKIPVQFNVLSVNEEELIMEDGMIKLLRLK